MLTRDLPFSVKHRGRHFLPIIVVSQSREQEIASVGSTCSLGSFSRMCSQGLILKKGPLNSGLLQTFNCWKHSVIMSI